MKITEKYDENINNAKYRISKIHKKKLEKEKENEKEIIEKMLNKYEMGIKINEEKSIFFRYYSFVGESEKTEMKSISKIAEDLFNDLEEYRVRSESTSNQYHCNFTIYLKRIK